MPHTDYMINDAAVAYWRRQKLAQAVIERLMAGARDGPTRRPGRRTSLYFPGDCHMSCGQAEQPFGRGLNFRLGDPGA